MRPDRFFDFRDMFRNMAPDETMRGVVGILLGFVTYYWFSSLTVLETVLLLRFFSLGLLCFAIYVYISDFVQPTVCVFVATDECRLSEKLEEAKELAETPAPSTPTEESAEFADLVSEKNLHLS